jgi:hypothetical protein
MTNNSTYQDDRFSIRIENEIVEVVFKREYCDYDFVNDLITERLKITKTNTYPMFSDFRKVKKGPRDARARLAEKDAGIGVSAVACLIENDVHRVMWNFFHSIYRPPAPTKLFTDKDKALKWLEKYKCKIL